MFSSIMKAAVAATALFGSPALADLGRPTLFSDGLSSHVNKEFLQYMPSTPSINSSWPWGWIPKRCADEAKRHKVQFNSSDFEVFNVQYEDCEEAWIFCRHTKAQLSQSQLIDYFGRLPVHERQSVSHVMAVPGRGSAYEAGGVVVFQGKTASLSIFQHEVGHAVDAYNNPDGSSSSTQEYLDAIDGDTCVPDDYANSSNVEAYTQVGVLLMYNTVVPGGLDNIGADYTCLSKQLAVVAARQQAAMQLGGTCSWRHPYGKVVSMDPESGNNKRAVGPKPVMNLVAGHPLAVEKDINRGGEVTYYGNVSSDEAEDALAVEKQASWNAKARHRAVRRNI
ncbi:hypothetical protein V493_07131 [Pseudogymnoascus sp. VKM F-4281 (FW-2241)]|nr:hypothetical protein V493_07131 [Pseudogymnoascus sp. VKM F-4281 (FW-2241)]